MKETLVSFVKCVNYIFSRKIYFSVVSVCRNKGKSINEGEYKMGKYLGLRNREK